MAVLRRSQWWDLTGCLTSLYLLGLVELLQNRKAGSRAGKDPRKAKTKMVFFCRELVCSLGDHLHQHMKPRVISQGHAGCRTAAVHRAGILE